MWTTRLTLAKYAHQQLYPATSRSEGSCMWATPKIYAITLPSLHSPHHFAAPTSHMLCSSVDVLAGILQHLMKCPLLSVCCSPSVFFTWSLLVAVMQSLAAPYFYQHSLGWGGAPQLSCAFAWLRHLAQDCHEREREPEQRAASHNRSPFTGPGFF